MNGGGLSDLERITDAALATLELDALLQAIITRAREVFAADTAAALLHDEASGELYLAAASGCDVPGLRFPSNRGLAGRILAENRTFIAEDLTKVELANPALLEQGVRSVMGVPLRVADRVIGVVHVGTIAPRQFTVSEASLLQLAADRIALAVEHARLYDAVVRANRARDEVLAVVAHDLRSPLNGIVLSASTVQRLARRPGGGAAVQDAATAILESAGRMDRLIGDLLDAARLDAGQLELARERLAPAGLVGEALELARPLASAKGIALTASVAAALPELDADRHRALQVFSNLLGNAVKFTDAGGAVRVTAECAGQFVRFAVADTGPGIRPEHLPRVFDRFWRARPGDQRGTGLGLAIARDIVRRHGGEIAVESRPGEGATFRFTLPVAR